MRRSARSFLFRTAIVALLVGAAAVAQPAGSQTGQPIQIDRNGALILIRSTLIALDHADRTGNYTVLRDLGAPGFQTANTAARLSEIFANLRAQNADLSGVAVIEPQLTVLPTTVQGGLMRMAGVFPSVPLQVNFEMLFAPVEGRWRLFGIAVNVGQSGPAAPMPQAPDKPPTDKPPVPEAKAEAKPELKPAAAPTKAPQQRRGTPQRPSAQETAQ
jgi:hypothetical protein